MPVIRASAIDRRDNIRGSAIPGKCSPVVSVTMPPTLPPGTSSWHSSRTQYRRTVVPGLITRGFRLGVGPRRAHNRGALMSANPDVRRDARLSTPAAPAGVVATSTSTGATRRAGARTSLVDRNGAAVELLLIQAGDCRRSLLIAFHFDEAESSGLPSDTVANDRSTADGSKRGESSRKTFVRRLLRQVSNIDLLHDIRPSSELCLFSLMLPRGEPHLLSFGLTQ